MMGIFRIIWYLLVILMAVMPAVGAFAGSNGIVRLRDRVDVVSSTFTLTDIAALEDLPGKQKVSLNKLVVGRAPRPGQWATVTRTEIAAILEKASPGITRKIRWQGPGFTRIRGGGVRCDTSEMAKRAQNFLEQQLAERYDAPSVRLVDAPRPIIAPVGRVSFHPKMAKAMRLRKRMPVWVDIQVDGQHFQTTPLWFDVRVHGRVWVAQKDLSAKEALSAQSAASCIRDMAGLNDEPVTATSLAGMRMVRGVAEGQILTLQDLAPIPAVSRGETITVFVGHGAVRLLVKAVALADGKVSQRIDVRNPNSGESFSATVIGTKQAMVN